MPFPVNNVEVASYFPVNIFDKTASRTLASIDQNSAVFQYYLEKFGQHISADTL